MYTQFAATQQVPIGAPFTAIKSAGSATDTDAVNIRYGKLAVGLWDRFVLVLGFATRAAVS